MGGSDRIREWWETAQRIRRQRAHERDVREWTDERERLSTLIHIAEEAQSPSRRPAAWLGVQLEMDERQLLSLPSVQLLEASRSVQRSQGGYAEVGVSIPFTVKVGGQRDHTVVDPVEESTVVDHGRATITNRRVVFRGPKHTRVWKFDELVGLDVDPFVPIVYFQHCERPKTGGLRFPPTLRTKVEDHLEVAVALSRDQADVYIAALRDRLRRHDQRRPALPAPPPRALPTSVPRPPPAPPASQPTTPRPRPRAAPAPPTAKPVRNATPTIANQASGPSGLVRREHDIAGLPRRLLARTFDAFIYMIVLSISVNLLLWGDSSVVDTITEVMALIASIALVIALEAGLSATGQGVLGKRLIGATVVDADTGRRPPLPRLVLRALVIAGLCLTLIGPLIDLAVALRDPRRRSLHDRAARTVVLRTAH